MDFSNRIENKKEILKDFDIIPNILMESWKQALIYLENNWIIFYPQQY